MVLLKKLFYAKPSDTRLVHLLQVLILILFFILVRTPASVIVYYWSCWASFLLLALYAMTQKLSADWIWIAPRLIQIKTGMFSILKNTVWESSFLLFFSDQMMNKVKSHASIAEDFTYIAQNAIPILKMGYFQMDLCLFYAYFLTNTLIALFSMFNLMTLNTKETLTQYLFQTVSSLFKR
jgi:hypothetical protein